MKILGYLNTYDIGSCRQVSRQLHRLCHDPLLLKIHQHIYVDGKIYLKEQAYTDPELLESILTNSTENDLEWLVSRQTRIMHGISKMAWCLSFNVLPPLRRAVGYAAKCFGESILDDTNQTVDRSDWCAAWYEAMHDSWDAIECMDVHDVEDDHATAERAVDDAAERAISAALQDGMAMRILSKYSKPKQLGEKIWQVYECLILLRLDQSFYREVETITVDNGLSDINFNIYEMPPSNPWTTQYHELFG